MASIDALSQPDALPKSLARRQLQDHEREWAHLIKNKKPLLLLDLPLDILQTIIREITHTNDLSSLALTHSVLHALVIPHIYSRFDIVWPDAGPTVESRVGVDALTYGLATLVMAQDVFGEGRYQPASSPCTKCGSWKFCQHRSIPVQPRKIRRGNYFAQYTRKFSLGNGPEDWVKEYLITKEGGKMLGTLVALAVGRMRNLETFTWDMPTGVLRDVWLALASLDGREDGQECRLEKVWVRWHDNQDTLVSPPLTGAPNTLPDLPHLISGTTRPSFRIPPYPRVEFPTFSVLPPLKSLSILDIDEISYVEEISVLVERSLSKLHELRVGLAHHAQNRLWAKPREDRTFVPPPLMQFGEPVLRKGGFLGVLVSQFCPAFSDVEAEMDQLGNVQAESTNALSGESTISKNGTGSKLEITSPSSCDNDVNALGHLLSVQNLDAEPVQDVDGITNHIEDQSSAVFPTLSPLQRSSSSSSDVHKDDAKKLRLQVLELERVYLSIPVLSRAFDWSTLKTLTILSCRDHEQLWKALRKRFTPPAHTRSLSFSKTSTPSANCAQRRSISGSTLVIPTTEYRLCLTRIHTDTVSAALLAFLKDTLAPDTLEHLFLQQSTAYKSTVTIDQIYKHAVRRHRASLKKLLIDSDLRAVDGSPDGNTNWRKWAASRELITCITSGRMHLRELSLSVDYKDWHYFLQRLPNASKVRSLHISHIADYVHNRIDPREAALQVLDIVALRPELELCYLGIQGKCFEILEYPSNRKAPPTPSEPADIMPPSQPDDDDISDEHDEHDGNDDDSDDLNLNTDNEDLDETEDEALQGKKKTALRLREILFYDDKISIFKARHGRL